MESKMLRSFIAVVDSGSFTKAAEKTYTSQPTVSAHIKALEEELGVQLIARDTKNLRVTQKGKELYDCACQMLALQQNMLERWAGEGKVVICDRYFASTLAYQSSDLDGEGIDRDWLVSASKPFVGKPDLTVLLDIDPEASLARVSSRGEEISKFERLDFLRRVRGEYLRLAELHGFAVIDASRGLDQVAADVLSRIEEVL